jgi:hypothetical protein
LHELSADALSLALWRDRDGIDLSQSCRVPMQAGAPDYLTSAITGHQEILDAADNCSR